MPKRARAEGGGGGRAKRAKVLLSNFHVMLPTDESWPGLWRHMRDKRKNLPKIDFVRKDVLAAGVGVDKASLTETNMVQLFDKLTALSWVDTWQRVIARGTQESKHMNVVYWPLTQTYIDTLIKEIADTILVALRCDEIHAKVIAHFYLLAAHRGLIQKFKEDNIPESEWRNAMGYGLLAIMSGTRWKSSWYAKCVRFWALNALSQDHPWRPTFQRMNEYYDANTGHGGHGASASSAAAAAGSAAASTPGASISFPAAASTPVASTPVASPFPAAASPILIPASPGLPAVRSPIANDLSFNSLELSSSASSEQLFAALIKMPNPLEDISQDDLRDLEEVMERAAAEAKQSEEAELRTQAGGSGGAAAGAGAGTLQLRRAYSLRF